MRPMIATAALAALLSSACSSESGCGGSEPVRRQGDVTLVELPLDGPLARDRAEISGLCWRGDELIFLPQYPDRFPHPGGGQGSLFRLRRDEVEAAIDGGAGAVTPRPIRLVAPELEDQLEGWQGFEAILFHDDQVYLTIEAGVDRGGRGFLVRGQMSADGGEVRLDPSSLQQIPDQQMLPNLAYESLVLVGDELLVLHEANARWSNPRAAVRRYGLDLRRRGDLELPSIEHRITDATAIDGAGRFWVINYRWAEDRQLHPEGTPTDAVERLIELELGPGRLRRTSRSPIDLGSESEGRNWEGLVRLDDRGFLIVTDRHPRTVFAFVPWSEGEQR